MLSDKNNFQKDDEDDFNLSDMINEYDEDDGLRQKIEAMKLEKAQEEAKRAIEDEKRREENKVHSALDNTSSEPLPSEESRNTFLDVDKTQTDLGDTRVIDRDDVDKTLVIMDNQYHRNYDENEEEESIYVYDNHEVDAEEITEEDIKEFLGDEDEVKKQRKKMDPNKMNKMITYGITGVVALCILVASGFGIKMLMDSFGEKTPEVEPSDKPEEKDPNKKDEPTIKDPKPQEKPTTPVDNSVRIAEIKGTIKALQDQVSKITSSRDAAEAEVKRLSSEYDPLSVAYAKADTEYKAAKYEVSIKAEEDARDAAQKLLDANSEDAAAKVAKETAEKNLERLNAENLAAIKNLADVKKLADDKQIEKNKKVEEKDSLTSEITKKQNEIQSLQTELSTLQ